MNNQRPPAVFNFKSKPQQQQGGKSKSKSKSKSKPKGSSSSSSSQQQVLSPRAQQLLHHINPKKYSSFESTALKLDSMDTGEHQWMIDAKLLKPMITAKNQEKFISPKFKMSHLIWQIEAYPNGNTPSTIGSFNLYLRLITMPLAWKSITICRTFTCCETRSGYTAVSRYEKGTSLGWPDFNLSLQDIKNRIHWIKALKFTINIKILQIKLNKNDGMIFYENKVDPYKSLKKQTLSWKIDEGLLHEMKQSYFKKGYVSPVYNNMWCLRVYPNGKTIKGVFLIQLQLCGLPGQTNKIKVNWKISCHAVSVSAGWTTNFDYSQSCWGWGNNQLTFEQFKKCNKFTISTDIQVDDKENIIAMCEWEKYITKKSKPTLKISDIKQYAQWSMSQNQQYLGSHSPEMKDNSNEPKDDHMIGITRPSVSVPPPPSQPPKSVSSQSVPPSIMNQLNDNEDVMANEEINEWVEKRLKIQDDVLEELTKEIDQLKGDIQRISSNSNNNQNVDDLKRQIASVQRQLTEIRKMSGGKININDDFKEELNDKQKVQKWLDEKVKLSQYFELFIQQGFDDLDSIKDITKEDLNEMGIDKVGHQRKILKNAEQI